MQKSELTVGCKCCFVGDLHGAFGSLIEILIDAKRRGLLDEEYHVIDHQNKFVFLGDYVDRHFCGVEVLYALAMFALKNPGCVILHRGNHETCSPNYWESCSFFNELVCKFGSGSACAKVLALRFYEYLSVATYIICGKNVIHASHGGYSCDYFPEILLNGVAARFEIISPKFVEDFTWSDFAGLSRNLCKWIFVSFYWTMICSLKKIWS